jgi:signal transduction histidine kinase
MMKDSTAPEIRNAFVSKVSHELRTPLAGIKAYIELLIDGEAQDDRTRLEFYEVIQDEANRLGQLIDDILSISKIEAGVARVQKQLVEINALVSEITSAAASVAERKNLVICETLSPTAYQTSADREMLRQAFATLFSNAIKFSPVGGRITVETATNPHQNTVLIRICDEGPGVEPKDAPGVFDKFSGAQTCARTAGGAGIGLTLVRQIVETIHAGAVFAEARPGRGNCFGIQLHLCAPELRQMPLAS